MVFEDELDDFSQRSADRVVGESALVPPIFPVEVANALFFAGKKRRITEDDVRMALTRIAELPIRVDSREFALHDELELAKKYDLTLYDATYLALARRHRIPLLTRDALLRRAAVKEKLPL